MPPSRRAWIFVALATLVASANVACGIPPNARVQYLVTDESPIIVYGASWCPHTAEATAYFDAHHLAYVMRDVDRFPSLRDEMDHKVEHAGLARTGIPVLDIEGRILIGFEQGQVERVLQSAR
jgi:glutaredoxin-related protein